MTRRRTNAGEGYGMMFHGAFAEKQDAVAKERKTKGAFIRGMPTKHGYRYVVMSPRTNPPRRRRKNKDKPHADLFMRKSSITGKRIGKATRVTFPDGQVIEFTERLPKRLAIQQAIEHREKGTNPSELIVLGANPAALAGGTGEQLPQYEVTREFIGGALKGLTHTEITTVGFKEGQVVDAPIGGSPYRIISVKRLNPTRENFTLRKPFSGGRSFFGPGLIRTTRQKRVAGMVRKRRSAGLISDAEYKRLSKSARAARPSKKKLAGLFHELYGQNPGAAICGQPTGAGPCTRKPGHKGPHLPQGATLRPRSRTPHAWHGRRNPSAAELRETFVGREPEDVFTTTEPHMPRGDYAQLGELLALYVKPRAGGQVQKIGFTTASTRPLVVADQDGGIWFLGGDQDLTDALPAFSGALQRSDGLYDLGEARRIDYKQRKEHVPDPEVDEWRHNFGEETGEYPIVFFDPGHKRILLKGGAYEIRAEGIVN
jgi:hypothetical protein